MVRIFEGLNEEMLNGNNVMLNVQNSLVACCKRINYTYTYLRHRVRSHLSQTQHAEHVFLSKVHFKNHASRDYVIKQ